MKNIKNKLLALLMCGVIVSGAVIAPMAPVVYATSSSEDQTEFNDSTLFATTPAQTSEDSEAETSDANDVESSESATISVDSTTPTEEVEEPKVFDWANYSDKEDQINVSNFTTESAYVYALTVSAKVVEDFDEDCYIYLVETTHQEHKLRIDLFPEDDFTRTVYLPEGYYQVVEEGAKNAPTLTFKVTVSAVSLSFESSNPTIQMVLNNSGKVEKNALGVWADTTTTEEETDKDAKIFGVEALEGIQSDAKGVLYYSPEHLGVKKTRMVDKEVEVMKEGQKVTEIQQVEEIYYEDPGLGYVTVFGSAIQDTDMVLLISKGGVVGQAEFKISYDGGLTFAAKSVTGEDITDSNINLHYSFYTLNDNDEFTEGDRFVFRTLESFEVENSGSDPKTRISCVGHPTMNHELAITILSSGGRGVSRVKVEDKKGNMETKTYLIPSDGAMVLDDNLTIYFENVEGYVKGVTYTIKIASHDTTVNYTPLIALCICVVVLLIMALFWLLMKKDKKGDYIVHPYQWKQDESQYE